MTPSPTYPAPRGTSADRARLSSPAGAESFTKLKVLDLFSGIGGFSLGLERTGGFETVAFCEIEDFPRRVLAKHWPDVPCYRDVRELTGEQLCADGISVDVITGGFPCQDISLAGNQAGIGEGTRSGLWSEIVRLVRDIRPSFVIVENVANLLSGPSERPGWWFGRVLGDLAECGYDAEWENIPAGTMGAPHRRERVWVVAYPSQERREEEGQFRHNQSSERLPCGGETIVSSYAWKARAEGRIEEQVSGISAFSWCQNVRRAEDLRGRPDIPPPLFRGSRDGVPHWVDRVGACGNAVVPQIPELIGRAILSSLGVLSSHRPVKLEGCVNPTAAPLQTIAALGAQARDDLTDQPHRAGFGILTFPAERLIEAHAAEQDWRAA